MLLDTGDVNQQLMVSWFQEETQGWMLTAYTLTLPKRLNKRFHLDFLKVSLSLSHLEFIEFIEICMPPHLFKQSIKLFYTEHVITL